MYHYINIQGISNSTFIMCFGNLHQVATLVNQLCTNKSGIIAVQANNL